MAGARFWCCARRAASRAAPERSFRPPPWWRLLRACRRCAARRRRLQRGPTRVAVWGVAAPPLPHRRPPLRAWRVVRLASCLASYRQGAGEVFRPAGGPGKSAYRSTQIWTNSGILFQQRYRLRSRALSRSRARALQGGVLQKKKTMVKWYDRLRLDAPTNIHHTTVAYARPQLNYSPYV